MSVLTLAHLSDLHVTPVSIRRPSALLNKRMLGALSWAFRRRRKYRADVLAALLDDLQTHAPDHVAITGDLTNLGLADEYADALTWLERLGGPRRVSLIPGNHDVYTSESAAYPWTYWGDYLRNRPEATNGRCGTDPTPTARAEEFPTLRVCGPAAIVGVSTARATAPFLASGTIGPDQLQRLEAMLDRLAETRHCRVVLVHHPPTTEAAPARRRLTDAAAFRTVLKKTGAELVLHGHSHRTLTTTAPGPHGPIPVVGVRAASARSRQADRGAGYHLYRIESRDGQAPEARFRIVLTARTYCPDEHTFRPAGDRLLSPAAG